MDELLRNGRVYFYLNSEQIASEHYISIPAGSNKTDKPHLKSRYFFRANVDSLERAIVMIKSPSTANFFFKFIQGLDVDR